MYLFGQFLKLKLSLAIYFCFTEGTVDATEGT